MPPSVNKAKRPQVRQVDRPHRLLRVRGTRPLDRRRPRLGGRRRQGAGVGGGARVVGAPAHQRLTTDWMSRARPRGRACYRCAGLHPQYRRARGDPPARAGRREDPHAVGVLPPTCGIGGRARRRAVEAHPVMVTDNGLATRMTSVASITRAVRSRGCTPASKTGSRCWATSTGRRCTTTSGRRSMSRCSG